MQLTAQVAVVVAEPETGQQMASVALAVFMAAAARRLAGPAVLRPTAARALRAS